ncbi:MAG: portal protein [Clostridium sp.]
MKDKNNKEIPAIVQRVKQFYKASYDSKANLHTQWKDNYSAYTGETFKKKHETNDRSNAIPNHIFATVETVKPIMLTNLPKNIVLPKTANGYSKAQLVQQALEYEWDRTSLLTKLQQSLTDESLYGNMILGLFWNQKASKGIGEVELRQISPFNFFIDPMATTIDEASYCIYATYKPYGQIVQAYPDKAKELENSKTNDVDENLSFGKNTENAKDQLLYVECYMRDYSTELIEEENEDGEKVEKTKLKYKNGRRVVIAGDVLLHDGENPYEDGKFPFVSSSCYDLPNQFWGLSEVEPLISIQREICEIYDDIIENAHLCGNPVWIVDNNAGVEKNSLTNRKGLVVRKNPGTDVHREAPPPIPAYIQNILSDLKYDIQVVSGVFDATRGERPVSITSGVAIQALQDSSQGRIRLRTQKLEIMLEKLGSMWLNRIQQYWTLPRTIRIMGAEYEPNSYPLIINGQEVLFKDVTRDMVDGDFDIKIVTGSSMATNRSARMEQIIRLAQTPAEDGMPMLPRKTVLEYSELDNIQEIMDAFNVEKQRQAEMQQQQAQIESQSQQQQMQMQQQHEMQKLQLEKQAESQNKLIDYKMQSALQKENNRISSSKREFDENMPLEEFMAMISMMTREELFDFLKENPKALLVIKKLQTLSMKQGVQATSKGENENVETK